MTAERRDPSFLIITAAGFAATVAQILLLRELLVLFYGNEMSTALVLAGWLLWTGVGSAVGVGLMRRLAPGEGSLALLLTLQACGVPALVLLVRGARWLFGIPLGELAPWGTMLLVCFAAPVLFAPFAGMLFGWCWAFRGASASEGESARPLVIYVGEALGAAAGGLVFYFVLLRVATVWTAAWVVAALLLAVAGYVLATAGTEAGRFKVSWAVWVLAVIGITALATSGEDLETRSRRWQWGADLVDTRDTPFHNIAIFEERGQISVFVNGLWLATQPDPATAELAIHPVLLQHPDPRRALLLGGGPGGHLAEVLRHPSVESVDYVEQDPALIELTGGGLEAESHGLSVKDRVQVLQQDAGTFVRRTAESYDVIVMNVGDPINAQMNRFYTEENFSRLGERLHPGGILTFSVPGGGDMVGPSHARLLGSMYWTLRQVFPAVRAVPGERAWFFAAREEASLLLDPRVLGGRIGERGLDLVHVREDTLDDLMNPMRLDNLDAILADRQDSPINRQFAPICYFHGLMLWASQWHPALGHWIGRAAAVPTAWLVVGFGLIGILTILFFWLGEPRYRAAVGTSVMVVGAVGMVLQVVLILIFQILAGFAYLQLALIIALFMAGLAVGAVAVAVRMRSGRQDAWAILWLARVQGGVTLLPLLLVVFVSSSAEGMRQSLSTTAVAWLVTLASLFTGALGGSHFALAALASAAVGARVERTGGYLYAVDLAGAAGGALAAGLLLVPLLGIASTLLLLSLMSGVCWVVLLRRPGLAGHR